MTIPFTRRIGAALALLTVATAAYADRPRDEEEIRRVQQGQAQTWNQHDAAAYAALFTEDADVVNVVGWWWKGRTELQTRLATAFAFVFRDSTLTIQDVSVRFLTDDLALAHVTWTMTGARTPPGIPEPRQGIQTQVLRRQANRWLIAAFQNTNSVPEMPFPTGPPPASPR